MRRRSQFLHAFTLVELMVTASIIAISGSMVYYVLNTGTILFSRNVAANSTHTRARQALLRIENDLRQAVSQPRLVDRFRAPVVTATAAGVSFQLFAAGPFQVDEDAAKGGMMIDVHTNGQTPVVGQRLIVPTHEIESDIMAVSTKDGGKVAALTLADPLPREVVINAGGTKSNVQCFITDRVAYAVDGGELRRFPRSTSGAFAVLCRDVSSTSPFRLTGSGSRLVQVDIATYESSSHNRKHRVSEMALSALVATRFRLTAHQ